MDFYFLQSVQVNFTIGEIKIFITISEILNSEKLEDAFFYLKSSVINDLKKNFWSLDGVNMV